MAQKDLDKLIKELDQLIRAGQHGKVRKTLLTLGASNLPRPYLAPLANLARRVNMPKMTVSLLEPIVRPLFSINPPASLEEKALFGTGLSRLGVFKEAHSVLEPFHKSDYPDGLLFFAFNYIFQWNSSAAIPILKKYLTLPELPLYARLVGQLNLASCYNMDLREIESREIIKDLQNAIGQQSESSSFNLVFANSLELEAQLEIYKGQYDQALALIKRAEDKLKDTQSRYEFFVKKWKAIIDLLQNPKERGPRDVIARLKTEGATAGNWEATRDFEFFEAVSVREKELFLRVYFGTPHESYRKRVYKIYHPDFRIPSHFDWLVSIPGGARATHTVALVPDVPEMTPRKFDLEKGCEIGGKAMLAQHPLLLNLLRLLCRDFYRPIPLGTLVSELYPDEYYNPVTSPEKAHRAVKRLRIWFKENDIPLTVTLKNNAFRLLATGPYIVSTTMKHELVGKNEAYLERLKAHFGSQTFNAKSAAEVLDVSINTALKFLRWSVEGKKILQLAGGRSSKYKISPS